MNRLDIYILRLYVWPFLITLMALIGLWFVIDTFSNMDDIITAMQGNSAREAFGLVMSYYFYQIPGVFSFIVPVVAVISAVFVIRHLRQNNELTGIKAAGISVHRAILALFIAAFAVSILMVLNREYVVPRVSPYMNSLAKSVSERIKKREAKKMRNLRFADDRGAFFQTIEVDTAKSKDEDGETNQTEGADARVIVQGRNNEEMWRLHLESDKIEWDGDKKEWTLGKINTGYFMSGKSDMLFLLEEDKYGVILRIPVRGSDLRMSSSVREIADAYANSSTFVKTYAVDRAGWTVTCQGTPQDAVPYEGVITFDNFSFASFYLQGEKGLWRYQVLCKSAELDINKQEWVLYNPGIWVSTGQDSFNLEMKKFASPATHMYFTREEAERNPNELTLSELRKLKMFPVLRFELYSRIAEPFTPIILMLLVISLALGRDESRHALVGIGLSIAVCVTFFICLIIARSMGVNNVIRPEYAAVLPYFIFFCVGGYLYSRIET